MTRVLVVGDAVAPTGFGRVLHSILDRLADTFEFHHLGINYFGDPHASTWKIYPAGTLGDQLGFNRLASLVASVRPQLVFLLSDPWVVMQYAGILVRTAPRVPCIAYFPVESDPVEPGMMAHLLRGADVLATYTTFGAREVQRAVEIARRAERELPAREIVIVPHGVDRRVFYPLVSDEPGARKKSLAAARAALFPERPELQNAFIVLNANRNQPRKRIDVTMEAFARFAHDKPPNVMLYLHMARQDVGWDIQRLAQRLAISDRLLVTNDDNRCQEQPVEHLNLIYNACDIGVNTASAEGWGLVAFEHAATGAAQIVPGHTSQTELWDGAAELVEPTFSLTTEGTLMRAYYVSSEDVAKAMQRLYCDATRRDRLSRAAAGRAFLPSYDWEVISAQWRQIFERTVNRFNGVVE